MCKWVRRRKKEYNPQWGSIVACVVTRGSLLSSATPGYRKYNRDAVGHTTWSGMRKQICHRAKAVAHGIGRWALAKIPLREGR